MSRSRKPNIINLPKHVDSSSDDSCSDDDIVAPTKHVIAKHIDNIFITNKSLLDIDYVEDDQIQSDNIHIRVQQRRANSYITTAQGISSKLDLKAILKALKHTLHCNGSISRDPEHGDIVQLSGDQRERVKTFLIDEGICEKNQIIMHGF